MYAHALNWWTILRIALEERLVYRTDFALGTAMRFLPTITQVFFWRAVLESVRSGGGEGNVAGYTFEQMVAYLLLTMLSRAFSSMPGLASGVAMQIRNGEVKKYLIQPVDMLGFLLLQRVAHKLAYFSVAFIPFGIVFFLCRGFFTDVVFNIETISAFVAALLMGFLLGYFLEASIGLIGFWFLEVSSLLFVYMLLSFFLSGHMFPLDFLPTEPINWQAIVRFSPLQYLAYFPAAVLLGKVQGAELITGLWVEAAWIGFFILVSRIMWRMGVKRYSGYGG
ncbi:MAG: ABC-2 family transporter protein [Pirellulaceae bacterium]